MNADHSMEMHAPFRQFAAALVAVSLMSLAQALPAPAPAKAATLTNAPAATEIITRSEFNERLPQGKDPFFPRSTRRVPVVVTTSTTVAVAKPLFDASQFVLKGISGSANQRLAIINDRTFAAGENQEVITRTGKMQIECKEIRNTSVLISFGNPAQTLELRLPGAF